MIKIKVCGLTDPQNILRVAALSPDFIGINFVPTSPRSVDHYKGVKITSQLIAALPPCCSAVAVFQNSPLPTVLSVVKQFGFRTVQLHGDESPHYCTTLKQTRPELVIIKALSLEPVGSGSRELSDKAAHYTGSIDFLLFDTAATGHSSRAKVDGGSGKKWDWSLLSILAKDSPPFFIAGGIGPDDVGELKQLQSNCGSLIGIDINSRFETHPGIKDLALLTPFVTEIRR